MLGPVEVRGAARSFRRSAALELVVYLAFHRHGVSQGECAVAIWPERPVSPSTLHATASDARRTLGHDAGGAYLPRGTRLCLQHSVGTDAERFVELAESDDPWRLRQALSLVRGPLFSGLRRIDWAVLDGTRHDLETSIVAGSLAGCSNVPQPWPRGPGGVDGAARAGGESLRRAALPRVAPRRPPRKGTGHDWLVPWHSCSPSLVRPSRVRRPALVFQGGAGRRSRRYSAACTPGRRLSTTTCFRVSLPPEGAPPGCRVASRHGEKFLRKVGRTRCRDGWWRHLSRADAGELVRRAPGHCAGRGRIGRVRQVPLQPDPPVVEPTIGTTWHAGLAFDICGTMESPLAASPSGARPG